MPCFAADVVVALRKADGFAPGEEVILTAGGTYFRDEAATALLRMRQGIGLDP